MVKNFDNYTNQQFADKYKCDISTIRVIFHARKMFRQEMEYWTPVQVKFLKDNYKTIGDKELAIIFNKRWEKKKGWTFKHIEKKRLYLKLNRSPAQLLKIKLRNKERGCWMNTTTWKTRGEMPNGTIRIWYAHYGQTRHAFKVIKVKGKYFHYGRYLYEKTYGKMPAGMVTGFIDGNNMNVVPHNLEAITRAQHAFRNKSGRTKLPPQLQSLQQILHKLENKLSILNKYDHG